MKKTYLPALGLLAAIATGCGQSAYNENAAAGGAGAAANNGALPNYNYPSGGTTATGTTSTTPSDPNLADPYRFTFAVAGTTTPPNGQGRPGPTSQTVSGIFTDNKLQVSISGGDPGSVPQSGFTPAYSCLRVNVTVLGQTQTAFVTNTGVPGWGYCQGAVPSQTLDFTSRVTQGHQAVTVQISNAMYDNCRIAQPYSPYNIYYYGCAMTAVYWNHIVSGRIEVHTNGTN